MKSMKHIKMPRVDVSIKSNSNDEIEAMSAEILRIAVDSIDNRSYLKDIALHYGLKRTDGNSVISLRGIHKNACLHFQQSEKDRRELALFAVTTKVSAEAAIGSQVFHTYKALKMTLTHPRVLALVHEACSTMYEKGFNGTFSLSYKA